MIYQPDKNFTLLHRTDPPACLAESLQVQQLNVHTDTKTSDNVTVAVTTTVLYRVGHETKEQFRDAVYKLQSPHQQMSAYVDDEVRSELPRLTLDQAYENKDDMASNVHRTLQAAMDQYGIYIQKILIVDLQPDGKVLQAMNEINTQKRNRAAAQEKAEGEKIMRVKEAEADMEVGRSSLFSNTFCMKNPVFPNALRKSVAAQ